MTDISKTQFQRTPRSAVHLFTSVKLKKKGRCHINVDFDINTQRIIFIFCYNLSDTYADYVTRIQGNHTSRLTML